MIELDGCKKGPHLIQEDATDVLLDSVKEIKRKLEEGEISDKLSCMTLTANTGF